MTNQESKIQQNTVARRSRLCEHVLQRLAEKHVWQSSVLSTNKSVTSVCFVSLQRWQYSGLPRHPTPLLLFNKAVFAIGTMVLFENYMFIHNKSGVGHLAMTNKNAKIHEVWFMFLSSSIFTHAVLHCIYYFPKTVLALKNKRN